MNNWKCNPNALARSYKLITLAAGLLAFLLWQNWTVNAQTPQHSLTVTWGAVTQDTAGNAITIDGYNVYWGISAGQTTAKLTATPIAATSFSYTSGTAGLRYFFTVTAVKGAFESAKSNEVSAVFIGDPKAPAGVSVIAQ